MEESLRARQLQFIRAAYFRLLQDGISMVSEHLHALLAAQDSSHVTIVGGQGRTNKA